jgi:CRP/FNR family transcriptional regulator, nitrogen oxide reductase regulator
MKPFTAEERIALAKLDLFADLEPPQLSEIMTAAGRRTVEAGRILFFQGDPAETFYIVLKGRVKLSQVTPDGQQVILRYSTSGESFGVIAVLSEMEYPVTAEAAAECQLLTWNRSTMRQLMERYPQIALNSLQILASRVREFQDRMRELATERVERRLARALLRLAHQTGRKTPEGVLIGMPISRQNLAEMTGTTLFTVSRILSQWETQGLVKTGREQVTISFPHGLVVIAEDLPDSRPPQD